MADGLRAGTPEHPTGHVIRDSSLGLVPETLPAILDLQGAIWHHASVGPAIMEMLRLRNARTVNCVFCKSVRYDIARADGLTEDRHTLGFIHRADLARLIFAALDEDRTIGHTIAAVDPSVHKPWR